jgi:predicted nuclease of predicted toxin-antitoxin system
MKLLIDMNLSPDWVTYLAQQGIESTYWSAVGSPHATDKELMGWARAHGHVVFTHDLDFGILLSLTQDTGPSVVQIRTFLILSRRQSGFAWFRPFECMNRT